MIHPLPKIEFTAIDVKHPAVPRDAHILAAHVTDIHMGPWIKRRHLEELVERTNHFKPDIVALTGDYVGYGKKAMVDCIEALDGFHAPTFAVLGNHDHWADTQLAIETFEKANIVLLQNENRVFDVQGIKINIVGVDDHVTKHADIEKAHRGIDSKLFTFTLNHVPDISDKCVESGSDLILAGHTHGMQFNIPRVTSRIAKLARMKYIDGCYDLEGGLLYVSRGLGSASWPRRVDAHPEIALISISYGETASIQKHTSWKAKIRK